MLRLDPGEGRIRTTRQFRAWEGGGEYNVTRGLRRCFGLRTAGVTAFADNGVDGGIMTASGGPSGPGGISPSADSASAAQSGCPTAA